MMSEQDLARHLAQAKAGDAASLGLLCEEARVRLQLVVKYRLGRWPEADREDLVQDALMTFCDKLQEIDRTPMAFALWILRQKIGNEFQKAYRNRERSFTEAFGLPGREGEDRIVEPPDPEDDLAVQYDRKETVERMRVAIRGLSDFCRAVFAGVLEGLRMQDIWEQYRQIEPGLQRSAFDKRTHDCRRKLFARMGAAE
ncbi:MAG TPA: sigma factor [bacterium]|jgi:DNA-directed RNA polymerase specialized sigma24 family protein